MASRNSEAIAESTKIVVAGGFGVGKTTFVASISEISPINTDVWMTAATTVVDRMDPGSDKQTTTVGMDFGRITLPNAQVVVYLFGTPGQARFWALWDDLCRGAVAAIVLVDTERLAESFAAVNYFDLENTIPFVVAVNMFHGRLTHSLPDIRTALALDPDTPITSVDARDRDSVKAALIFTIRHVLNQHRSADPRSINNTAPTVTRS